MKYDFETLIKRNNVGAFKWDAMKKIVPDIPDDEPIMIDDVTEKERLEEIKKKNNIE